MYYRNLRDGALHCYSSILGGYTALCERWFQYHRVNYPPSDTVIYHQSVMLSDFQDVHFEEVL